MLPTHTPTQVTADICHDNPSEVIHTVYMYVLHMYMSACLHIVSHVTSHYRIWYREMKSAVAYVT